MLDVMRKPPPVTVQVDWIATRVCVPDTDRTVMIYTPDDEDDPVWMGWWSTADECFKSAESGVPIGMVTWWAEKPAAPVEPKQ